MKQRTDVRGKCVGPARVYFSHERIPGLAMSRSLGDIAVKSIGVTAEPEIMKFDIFDNDSFIVIGSDGLWEYMNEADVNMILQRCSEAQAEEAVEKLIKEATFRWKKYNDVIDDITVIIIFLQ